MALAKRCGVSYYTLCLNWNKPGRPPMNAPGSSRYEVALFQDWVQTWKTGINTNARGENWWNPNPREQALIDRTNALAEREKFKLAVERGEYVRKVDAERDIETNNAVVRRELRKAFEYELPPRLEMLSAAEVRKILGVVLDELMSHMPKALKSANGNGTI